MKTLRKIMVLLILFGFFLIGISCGGGEKGDSSPVTSSSANNGTGAGGTGDVPVPLPSGFVAHSGVNLPWINYGWDIGRNPWGGAHGGFNNNQNALKEDFGFLSQHKIQIVRVFIFCDLRSGVVFDTQGNPTGFDSYALADFQTLVNIAEQYNLKIIPVLFDFHLADSNSEENGAPVGEHPELISDSSKRTALVDLFRTFIQGFATQECIFAWEVINEPEGASAVNQQDLKVFVREFVQMIHSEVPGSKVTLGCKDWSGLQDWIDVGLDIYQFHWYNESLALPSATQLNLDKPVLIGETKPINVSAKLNEAKQKGYLGMLFWSLNANYNFEGQAEDYYQWVEVHWTDQGGDF